MPRAPKKTRTTIDPQGWGGTTTQVVAPEPEPPAPIVVPEGDEARELLRRLAEANQRVIAARVKWEESATTTKQRKAKLDQLSAELSRMLSEATEGSKTPLLDAAEAEADLQRMEAAIAAGGEAPVEAEGASAETADQTDPSAAVNAPAEAQEATQATDAGAREEPDPVPLEAAGGVVVPFRPEAASQDTPADTPEIF